MWVDNGLDYVTVRDWKKLKSGDYIKIGPDKTFSISFQCRHTEPFFESLPTAKAIVHPSEQS